MKLAERGNVPRLVTAEDGSVIDRSTLKTKVSFQRQGRHVMGDPRYQEGNSYFKTHADAQDVLDSFHDGSADVLGRKGNDIVVRLPRATGFNNNPGAGFLDQPTAVHFIKGTKSPSVLPYNPNFTP